MKLTHDDLTGLGRRLRRVPITYRCYAWWKVRLDPIYALLLDELEGKAAAVVDLGSGMGLLEALLLARHPGLVVRAVERDSRKARVAERLTADLPGAVVRVGDALSTDLGCPDAILLIDLLHYFKHEEQAALLTKCAAALRPGGLLIVRELDGGAERGSTTHAIERLAVRFGWNRAARVQPRPIADLRAQLEAQGFQVAVSPAGLGPFAGNALLSARKIDG